MPEVRLQGVPVDYSIFRRKNNKYVRISVTRKGEVRVSVPWHYPNKYIPGVMQKYGVWILEELEKSRNKAPADYWQYADGSALPFLGKEYDLKYRYHSNGQASLLLRDKLALLELPHEYRRNLNKEGIDEFILGWYRHQAMKYIPRRTDQWAETMGVRYATLRLKDLRSRWGSCSAQKNINFNIRLMMLPRKVIDYVIIHELAHLKQLNHSRRFWSIVETYCPDYNDHREALRRGAALLGD